ncbi:MAG: hypothetical protein ABIS35_06695 [Terracoccus sp.]
MAGGHAVGVRIGYAEAPQCVRDWVDLSLGATVEQVVDCVGGMSPGPAARVRSARGVSGFVKACGAGLNPKTPGLLRDEARVLAALPIHAGLPRLLDVYDDGDWVALLIEDLPGSPPAAPWSRADLARVGALLLELRPVLDGVRLDGVARAVDSAPLLLTAWRTLGSRLDLVDTWWRDHHDALAWHAARAGDLIAGDSLLHWDIRADNVVLTPDRTVLVDWGQVRRGARWMDHALLALDCSMTGAEPSTAEVAALDPVLRDRDPADLLAIAAAAAMAFVARSTEPAPQGLPTLPATSARWAGALQPYLASTLLRLR